MCFQELVEIDSKKTAQLVLVGFANDITEVMQLLEANTKGLFAFLQGVFEHRYLITMI